MRMPGVTGAWAPISELRKQFGLEPGAERQGLTEEGDPHDGNRAR